MSSIPETLVRVRPSSDKGERTNERTDERTNGRTLVVRFRLIFALFKSANFQSEGWAKLRKHSFLAQVRFFAKYYLKQKKREGNFQAKETKDELDEVVRF